jgi:PAS domain S-box-containing protein
MADTKNWQRYFGALGDDSEAFRADVLALVPDDPADRSNIERLKVLDEHFDRLDRLYRIASEQFNQLADEMRAGVAILIGNIIIFANPKMAEILGYDRPEAIENTDYLSYMESDDAKALSTEINGQIKVVRRVTLRRADGALVEAECTRRALSYDAGARLTVVRLDERP